MIVFFLAFSQEAIPNMANIKKCTFLNTFPFLYIRTRMTAELSGFDVTS
jgi:hypothetical protein